MKRIKLFVDIDEMYPSYTFSEEKVYEEEYIRVDKKLWQKFLKASAKYWELKEKLINAYKKKWEDRK